jgi:hypothetical protein
LLQNICHDFVRLSLDYAGIVPTVTRVLERIEGSSGVHEAGRAVDFRDEFGGVLTYPENVRNAIVALLNHKYSRKDGKPTVLWHRFQGNPGHFHVQLAADVNTYRRKV